MPIYEYQCSECGHEFDVIQKISEKPIRKCEKCGRLKAKRMISKTTFVLKGTGWYATDYGNRKNTGHQSNSKSSSGKSPSKSADKSTASEKSGDGTKNKKKAS